MEDSSLCWSIIQRIYIYIYMLLLNSLYSLKVLLTSSLDSFILPLLVMMSLSSSAVRNPLESLSNTWPGEEILFLCFSFSSSSIKTCQQLMKERNKQYCVSWLIELIHYPKGTELEFLIFFRLIRKDKREKYIIKNNFHFLNRTILTNTKMHQHCK